MKIEFAYFDTPDGLHIRYGIIHPEKKVIGSVVFLNGRAEFIEKHAETYQDLNTRGFEIYTLDWRGQGLSSRMLNDRKKGFVATYDDYISDLHLFLKQYVMPAATHPVIMLTHSMGGHIALRFLHDYPGIVDKAVLLSPMIKINTAFMPYAVVRWMINQAKKRGATGYFIIGAKHFDPASRPFKKNPLTSDPERFLHERQAIAVNPELAIGGMTYGWLEASFESIDILFEKGFAGDIPTPLLMVCGSEERLVSIKAQIKFSDWMPNCRFLMLNGARHEILKEKNPVREKFWIEFDGFVK